MWDFVTENANAVMAIAAILTLVAGFLSWFFGLWGKRKASPKQIAKKGSVIVNGDVHGDVTTNNKRTKK